MQFSAAKCWFWTLAYLWPLAEAIQFTDSPPVRAFRFIKAQAAQWMLHIADSINLLKGQEAHVKLVDTKAS